MNKRNRKKGFGVLEVLLASIIIVIVVGALVFLARNTLKNSVYLQEKAQATYLAQEGIEIARQIRDTNYIDDDNTTQWNTIVKNGMGNPVVPNDYATDFFIDSSGEIKSGSVPAINIDNIDFKRKLNFKTSDLMQNDLGNLLQKKDASGSWVPDPDLQANAILVEVTVTWESAYKQGEITLKELLTNSHQGF